MIRLPTEFSDLLKLLNVHDVRYLVVGGFAVAWHGYPRATGDIDIWTERSRANAERIVRAVREFGFDVPQLREDTLVETNRILRMGNPPLRVEILTSISGVEFSPCFASRDEVVLGDLRIPVLNLVHLRENKRASGRHKDLDDLENLPDPDSGPENES